MTATGKPRVNYLNNKELLKEIHKSKCTYCWIKNDAYFMYDIIVTGLEEITPDIIETAVGQRLHRLNQLNFDKTVTEWRTTGSKGPKPKLAKCIEEAAITVEPEDVVYRVMTFSHIPDDLTRKNKPKTEADVHSKCNFPPYKHYIFKKNPKFDDRTFKRRKIMHNEPLICNFYYKILIRILQQPKLIIH